MCGFSNGYVPMFGVVGAGPVVYYMGNDRGEAMAAVDLAIAHFDGLHVSSALYDYQEFAFNETFNFDLDTLFTSETGDTITYEIVSNDVETILPATVDGNTLTITPSGEDRGTITVRALAGGQQMDFRLRVKSYDPDVVAQFETDLNTEPTDWTYGGTATTWQWGTYAALSSQYFSLGDSTTDYAFACNSDAAGDAGGLVEDWLISPAFDLTGLTSHRLVYDHIFKHGSVSSGYYNYLTVHYRTASDGEWVLLKDYGTEEATAWMEDFVPIPAEAITATTEFGFFFTDESTWGYGAAIDNFSVWAKPE